MADELLLQRLSTLYKVHPIYELLDEYIKKQHIVVGGLFILNIMFDNVRKYGMDFRYELFTPDPFVLGLELSNYLAKNGIYNILKTIILHKELHIIYDVYAFPIIAIFKSTDASKLEVKNGFFTYDYRIHLAKICYNLSDLSQAKNWEVFKYYRTCILKKCDINSQMNPLKPLAVSAPLKAQVQTFMEKYGDRCSFVGECAYCLLNNLTPGVLDICTEVPLDIIKQICKNINYQQQTIKFHEQIRLDVLILKQNSYIVRFYNLPTFMPLFIFKRISGKDFSSEKGVTNIADANICIYFLVLERTNVLSSTFINEQFKKVLLGNIDTCLAYFIGQPCPELSLSKDDYIGSYEPLSVYKRMQNINKNIHLSMYNPQVYYAMYHRYRDAKNEV